jgi:hypothetical protein
MARAQLGPLGPTTAQLHIYQAFPSSSKERPKKKDTRWKEFGSLTDYTKKNQHRLGIRHFVQLNVKVDINKKKKRDPGKQNNQRYHSSLYQDTTCIYFFKIWTLITWCKMLTYGCSNVPDDVTIVQWRCYCCRTLRRWRFAPLAPSEQFLSSFYSAQQHDVVSRHGVVSQMSADRRKLTRSLM